MTNIKTNSPVFSLHMPAAGEAGMIYGWVAGGRNILEFGGLPFSKWEPGHTSPFRELHDALSTMHSKDLHEGNIVTILPHHRDYETVYSLMEGQTGVHATGLGTVAKTDHRTRVRDRSHGRMIGIGSLMSARPQITLAVSRASGGGQLPPDRLAAMPSLPHNPRGRERSRLDHRGQPPTPATFTPRPRPSAAHRAQ